ncbi:MAG: UbiD family decarboxylase [Saprospiraceae bacterium]|nr:UbiD family decarboxylase [Saprospiraceae bacterium]
MSYKSLKHCVNDLEKHGKLLRIKSEVDPDLEMAEIHRRVFDAQGPAILYENVKGSPFPALSNLYGTIERTRFLFRHELEKVQKIIELKIDPIQILKQPGRYLSTPFSALNGLPKKVRFRKHILFGETKISQLPQIKSWEKDGGAFITLPQVFSMEPGGKDIMKSNLGMYRIQMSGNDYQIDKQIGLHYQLHRGIGVHHKAYNESDLPFKVSVFVGGPPSNAFAAIMPLPENLSELTFAGLLNGRRFRYFQKNDYIFSSDADFCITGTVIKDKKMLEGPFGDHLGYYSLAHDFPVLKVDKVYHRKDAIWHFTVVGRPPAEDSSFGYLIHELVKGLTPIEFPGLVELNAVDAAGVHPLLLAIGSERYMPFRERKPEEILTIANHLLGKGQTSLAKYLFIADIGDNPKLNTKDIKFYFKHILERIDWTRDLHFQTQTTIDTLDYSGESWNSGSKVVIACCGPQKRTLKTKLPTNFNLPVGFTNPVFVQEGILAIKAPPYLEPEQSKIDILSLTEYLKSFDLSSIPLILLVDDSTFVCKSLNNFIWVTFTRSNPSHDIHGVDEFTENKHWGCRSSLIIDARIKPNHAPPLLVDSKTKKNVDKLFDKGGALYGKL